MKKLAISIAVAAAIGLAGCGDSLEDIKQDVAEQGPVAPASRVIFDPAASKLSVPNDLLFQFPTQAADGSPLYSDGTLYMPGERDAEGFPLAAPAYGSDPSTALGALDGWSTQHPYPIEVDLRSGVALVPSSVAQPGAVRVFEMVMQDPMSADADCQTANRGFACKVVAELTFGIDFVTTVSGKNIVVVPLKPLKAATTYITALTSLIEDDNGNSLAPSTSYELVKQDVNTLPLALPTQRGLQRLINSFENVLSGEGVDKDTLVYTAAMTTQSIANVLATVKTLMAAPGSPYTPTALEVAAVAPVSMIPGSPFDGNPSFDNVMLYTGSFNLPYYLGAQTAEAPRAPLDNRWSALCDSGAILAQLPAAEKPEGPQSDADSLCLALSQGQLRDLGKDPQRHLTKFNTIPKINSTQAVEVILTAPNAVAPAEGWPVVILSHGITSCKENMLAVTAALTQQGFATAAIDHPLHGSRGFTGINATTSPSCGVQGGNATVYLNLSNLLVTRDILRQSIADTLALRYALNNATGINLNTANVQLLGTSLGSITGASAVALANMPSGNTDMDAAYRMQSAALTVPGGAIANFLRESASFGGLIRASIVLGADTLKEGFITYLSQKSDCMSQADNAEAFTNCAAAKIDEYIASAEPQVAAAINGTLAQFTFAAQTITDAGDPNNYAQLLVASETPVYIAEVIGTGINSATSDRVIPNQTLGMPLGGTEPLARLLGATAINAVAGPQPLEGNVIARFTAGSHSSLLDPTRDPLANPAVTQEMQLHVASFFVNQGAGIVVGNPAVLAPAN